MTTIISVMGRKGGITKTTTSTTLAAALARRGYTTLLLEADGQGSATARMGLEPLDGFYEYMLGGSQVASVVRDVPHAFTDDYHGSLRVLSAGAQTEMVEGYDREELPGLMYDRLTALRGWVDVIVVDTSPALNGIHYGCYYASDYLLLPTLCKKDSVDSLETMINTLIVAAHEGKVAEIAGILPNCYQPGRNGGRYSLGYIDGKFADAYHVFSHLNEMAIWEAAREDCHSIYSYTPANYGERKALEKAQAQFKPVVDHIEGLIAL